MSRTSFDPERPPFHFPTVPPRASPRARAARQRDALHRPGKPDGRPGLGLSVRGLEPGPGQGALPPLVHPVDRHRPVDGAAREHRRRHVRHALPLPRPGAGKPGAPGQEPAPGPARPAGSAPGTCWGTSSTWLPASGSARWPRTSKSTNSTTRSAGRKGEAIWKALQAKGWIVPRNNDREADIVRSAKYGSDHFDGPLAPFSDNATKQKIMDILDQRVVMVVFIDNANLSASVAKTIGALLEPRDQGPGRRSPSCGGSWNNSSTISSRDTPGSTTPRPASSTSAGTPPRIAISAGWTCRANGTTGHVDYLVNEFRGPATFVVTRFGLPIDADQESGLQDEAVPDAGRARRLCSGSLGGLGVPGSGPGAVDDGAGSPKLAQAPGERRRRRDRLCHAAQSFPASSRSRTAARAFSTPAASASPTSRSRPCPGSRTRPRSTPWARPTRSRPRRSSSSWRRTGRVVSSLLTEHGPWEGFKARQAGGDPVPDDGAHPRADPGSARNGIGPHESVPGIQGLRPRLDEIFRPGEEVDLLSGGTQVFAWNDKESPIRSSAREGPASTSRTDRLSNAGIAFVPSGSQGVNLSGGLLSLRYRSAVPIEPGHHHPETGRRAPRPSRPDPDPDLLPLRQHGWPGPELRFPSRPRLASRRSRRSSSRSGRNPKGGRSTCPSPICESCPSLRKGLSAKERDNLVE